MINTVYFGFTLSHKALEELLSFGKHTTADKIADAIIFATARSRGATLLTCDAHFEGLPGVRFVKKKSG